MLSICLMIIRGAGDFYLGEETDCPLAGDARLLNWEPGASSLARLLPNSGAICFVLHLEGSEEKWGLLCLCRGRGWGCAGWKMRFNSFSSHLAAEGEQKGLIWECTALSLLSECPQSSQSQQSEQLQGNSPNQTFIQTVGLCSEAAEFISFSNPG